MVPVRNQCHVGRGNEAVRMVEFELHPRLRQAQRAVTKKRSGCRLGDRRSARRVA